MKVICEQNNIVSKVWGKQKIKDKKYRLIKYSLTQRVDEGILLYNLVTGEMVLLKGVSEIKIDELDKEIYNILIEKHFLVPEDYNELKNIRQLKRIVANVMNNVQDVKGYTIMPTSHCNARCFYCFEADHPYVHMTNETADKVVDYMVKHCDEEKFLNITWFGGEPMVGSKRIDQICNGLKENGINYSSFMYSNGYLFDDEMVEKAVKLWKLDRIQITLDGTEEIYNQTKAYKSVSGSPFFTVLDNIKRLLDSNIHVIIRMNMDYYNFEDLKDLTELIAQRFAGYSNIEMYSSILFDDEGFEKVKHSDHDKRELEIKNNELKDFISEKMPGPTSKSVGKLPCLKALSCCADNDRSLLINPKGELGKCDHFPFTKIIGNVNSDSIDFEVCKLIKEEREFELCINCQLFPICKILNICTSSYCNSIRSDEMKKELYTTMFNTYYRYQDVEIDKG